MKCLKLVAVSRTLTGTGTAPIRIAPRNAIGKTMVSSRTSRIRCSRRTPGRGAGCPCG